MPSLWRVAHRGSDLSTVASADYGEDKMKISSEQKADIVRRIQVKNLDGTWAETYGALAKEFGVSGCLEHDPT